LPRIDARPGQGTPRLAKYECPCNPRKNAQGSARKNRISRLDAETEQHESATSTAATTALQTSGGDTLLLAVMQAKHSGYLHHETAGHPSVFTVRTPDEFGSLASDRELA